MSKLIPPLLNSSPPPIVGPLDEDEDDEFGDFRAATNSYDCDDFSLPPSPQKSPDKVIVNIGEKSTVLDINSNNNEKIIIDKNQLEIVEEICENDQKDFQDKRKSMAEDDDDDDDDDVKSDDIQVNSSNSLSNDSSSTFNEESGDNKIDNSEENGPNIDNRDDLNFKSCDSSKSNDLELSESNEIEDSIRINTDSIDNDEDDDFGDFETHFDKSPVEAIENDKFTKSDDNSIDSQIEGSKVDSIEDDFEENHSNSEESKNNFPTIQSEIESNETDNENFANFQTIETDDGNFAKFESTQYECGSNLDDKDDDFGAFETPPLSIQTKNKDDDFDDFSEFTSNHPVLLLDSNDVLNKCETIVKEIFPKIDNDIDDFRYIDNTENDKVFNLLKDVTETHAINYQWSKSNSQKVLLKALNIDMRNILYGPAWNSSCMPRFAANFTLTPLEPIKPEILTPTPVHNQSSPPSVDSSQDGQINNVDIPNVQFDWNDSGLINPLDYSQTILLDLEQLVVSLDIPTITTTNPSPSLSNELLDEWDIWLQSVPSKNESTQSYEEPNQNLEKSDLFLTTITEKIKNLTSSTSSSSSTTTPPIIINKTNDKKIKELESPKMIPLRETYISNNDNFNLDKPDWFQSTIQTPELPRKDEFFSDNNDDDFDDFQMVLPENNNSNDNNNKETPIIENVDLHILKDSNKQPIEETLNNNNNNNDDNEEFTDFHSSLPTVLQPVPLEPLKPSIVNQVLTPTQINWPEPGVSDEEIRNIELSYYRNKIEDNKSDLLVLENNIEITKHSSQQQNNNGGGDDDEWSDFVSVVPVPKSLTMTERTATPDLPLSVLNLNYIQPAKSPIPVITPNGLVQTKLSTNIENSPKSTNIVQTKIPTNYHQPTLITNQFNNIQSANFDLITSIQTTPIQANFNQITKPTTQFNSINNNIDDDDDWSDFVSSQPTINGYQTKTNVNRTNITTNPNFDTFKNYTNPIRKNSFINGQQKNNSGLSNIATIPDLDFIAPKSRTNKK